MHDAGRSAVADDGMIRRDPCRIKGAGQFVLPAITALLDQFTGSVITALTCSF